MDNYKYLKGTVPIQIEIILNKGRNTLNKILNALKNFNLQIFISHSETKSIKN